MSIAVTPLEKSRLLLAGALLSLLAACGGGGGEAPAAPPASVSAVIGPAGGTVTGPDGVQIVIPAGALRSDTTIGIARSDAGAPPLTGLVRGLGNAYEFTPHGQIFDVPVLLRMPIPAGGDGSSWLVASPGEDWSEHTARVSGGMTELVRNRLSWGYPGSTCAYNPNDPNLSLSGCVLPRGGTAATTLPAQALQLVNYPNWQGSAGSYRLEVAASVTFTTTYTQRADCISTRIKVYRRQLDRSPNLLETLYDQGAPLSPPTGTPPGMKVSGSVTLAPVTLTHADNGRHVYAFRVSCTLADQRTYTYGDDMVIHIAVPMPTSTQTIGGTVSGLTGTLVLRNNGGDDLSISADGAFSFATPVGTGAPYGVSVATQPAGQTCTVQNGSGTASANVSNVAVTCTNAPASGWLGEARIESGAGVASHPAVAVDGQGNALAVWMQHDGTRHDIWANRYVAGGNWGTPQRIEGGSGNAEYPAIAMDAAGNATAIWTQHDGTTMRVRAARYVAGTWGADEAVDAGSGTAREPHLGMDASGNAVAVWVQNDGGQQRIRTNRLVSGVWQGETSIDGAVGAAHAPQVAVFPDGTALAVWTQEQGGRVHLFHNRFNGMGWSTADLLYENTTSAIGTPRIAGNASGGAIVVWEQGTGAGASSTDVLASRYSGGLWTNPVTLSDINAQRAFDPRIAMTGDGRARVVWRESHADAFETWARPYEPDGGWATAPARLDGPLVDRSSGNGPLAVGVGPDGNAIAIWSYTAPGAQHNDLYASHYRQDDMLWGPPQQIENTNGGGTNSAALGVGANGSAVAVWDQDDGGPPHGDIWANVFP